MCFFTFLLVVFVQSASSAEDDTGDRQENKNLNKELDLNSSSSGTEASLPESRAGTAEADSIPVNGKLFIYLKNSMGLLFDFLTHLFCQMLMFLGQIVALQHQLPRVPVKLKEQKALLFPLLNVRKARAFSK